MKYSFFFLIVIFSLQISYGQCPPDSLNMTKIYNYDDDSQPTIGGNAYNDIWGYSDASGNEYAILGAADSIIVVDVTTPGSMARVDAADGYGGCIWRDMKTYGNYLYSSSECGDGLLIHDLSNLPTSITEVAQITTDFTSSHNIYIDSLNARLYVVGANSSSGVREGFLIYDLSTTPENPPLLKKLRLDTLPGEVTAANYYIHDIFVKNNIAYCSHAQTGYGIWDVNNVENIFKLDLVRIPVTGSATYTHSSWNTKSDSTAYVASEVFGTPQIYIIDQTDHTDISIVNTYKEPLLSCNGITDNVPHNPYIKDDLVYISYYEDGVQILDVTDEDMPVRVAYYDIDTTNTQYNSTTGNWGMYPFLPSGRVIASDVNKGLFVFELDPAIVPLILTSFTVKPTEDLEAFLSWDVEAAINVRAFEVERSTDGRNFVKMHDQNYFPDVTNYQFLDRNPKMGTNFYRIKIIDYDGSFEYSDIESIRLNNDIGISIYPTSTYGDLTINFSEAGKWNLKIYNGVGQAVSTHHIQEKSNSVDVSYLTSGMYHIVFENGSAQLTKSFQKLD